jgi:hypothetical protein
LVTEHRTENPTDGAEQHTYRGANRFAVPLHLAVRVCHTTRLAARL